METRDYSKFKFKEENREIKQKKVEELKQSIKNFGIIPGCPILINGEGFIIDGQHRFAAIKELKMPVPYEVITGDAIAKMMILNSTQTSWSLLDYIESYTAQNIDCYRKLLAFYNKYQFPISATISIATLGLISGAEMKRGKVFEMNKDADEIAEYILSLSALDFHKNKDFVRGIISLFKKANKEQLTYLQKNILSVQKRGSVADYIVVFENILNHKKRGDNRIKL